MKERQFPSELSFYNKFKAAAKIIAAITSNENISAEKALCPYRAMMKSEQR